MDLRVPPRVVIVGGGIAGLAAAFFLRDAPVSVTVLEGSPRLGGKLAVSEVAGIAVDEGAEALLARRPEGTGLIRAAGLAGRLVAPGTTTARIWSRGQMRPLPRRQVMGVPADLDDLARCRLLSVAGMARAREDLGLPTTPRGATWTWPATWRARFGQEVVDRLVDPLLGGVYAGRSEDLSFEATAPRPGRGVPPARVAGRGGGRADAGAGGQPRAPRRRPPSSPHSPAAWAPCRQPSPPRRARRCGPVRWSVSSRAPRAAGG